MNRYIRGYTFFYMLLLSTIAAIFFTHPFMRFPYDIWDHLIAIDNLNLSEVHGSRDIWHAFWRNIFSVLSIGQNEILLRARIIHVTQVLLAFFTLFFFSKVLTRHIFKEISPLALSYLAYWSTLIWFVIFATFSMHYHLIWILWYSVNYQITLPLFWYITALTIVIFFEQYSWTVKIFYILQIALISRFILQAHSMEYIYYLMYLLVLSTLYFKELFILFKKYFYLIIPTFILILFFLHQYQVEESPLITYLKGYHFSNLYASIAEQGNRLISGANRADAAVNELMKVALFAGWSMFAVLLLQKIKGDERKVNIRMFLFIFLTSLFIYIPLYTYTSGFAAVITKLDAVNRFYYSSSLFLLLPVTVYFFATLGGRKEHLFSINIIIITILLSTLIYSKHFSATHNFAKNVHSLIQSFNEKAIGFNLSEKNIKTVGKLLEGYDKNNKKILFYARPDIAVAIKFIYRKDVYWIGRRKNPSLESFQKYCLTLDPKETECTVFKTPKGFPKYIPYH